MSPSANPNPRNWEDIFTVLGNETWLCDYQILPNKWLNLVRQETKDPWLEMRVFYLKDKHVLMITPQGEWTPKSSGM